MTYAYHPPVILPEGSAYEVGRRAAAEAHAQYQPAVDAYGDEYWQHQCGYVTDLPENWSGWSSLSAECDGCGADVRPGEWRRLYVRDEAGS